MTAELATTTTTAIAPASYSADHNPALVYLASLSQSSRRPQRQSLDVVASIATSDTCTAIDMQWGALRYQHTQAIRTALGERYSAATANRHLSALRGVLKDAWRLGYMTAEDYQRAIDLKAIKGQKAMQAEKGRHLKAGEFVALINTCLDGTKAGIRDAAIIATAYTAGLRRAELAALTLEDYDADEYTLIVRNGKGNKERVIPITDSACDALADWLHIRGATPGALFTQIHKGDHLTFNGLTDQAIYYILSTRAEQAGVKAFSPHDLRRSFAGDLLDAGADIATVQKLMGHSNANTTAGYDRRDAQAKRKAVAKLHIPYRRQFE